MSGSSVSTSTHGAPDVGLTTLTEMVDRARQMVNAVDVPVFCDADTGYGNPLNVVRTVEEYESAGVAGIHLEDQTFRRSAATSTRNASFRPKRWYRRSKRPLMLVVTTISSSSPPNRRASGDRLRGRPRAITRVR